ncbi:Lpg1974 family pore-forming outer membrane protein [Roseimaritima sediminicola]|uniref:Lpg1974 family pore-forming outer membrane protein n=1 Tax=Roseimaritima sediminicola TaxID=2662066 RepID=UPI0012983627|nr:Lpg1974 family pore-forming outer membrane protein [Roseimaritima sediminicola]
MRMNSRLWVLLGVLAVFCGSARAEEATSVQDSAIQLAACTESYDTCAPACCTPPWAHQSGVFGELLLLRARDAEIAYGMSVNGAVPEGRVGVLDPEYDLGFRVGLTKALDHCSSFSLSYTNFNSSQDDRLDQAAPNSIQKLLVHPAEPNAAANVLTAFGAYDIDFQFADLDYRFVVLSNDCTAANFTIGARYGNLDQEMAVVYTGAGLTESITTDIDFDGAGLRLGADIEHHGNRGLFVYGKTAASFLAGEFHANYLHASTADPVRVASEWEAGRLVSILDLEVGAGWQHCSGLRASVGYTFSSWLGTVKTDDWIDAVRNNGQSFRDLSDDFTFDGFVGRVEYRF